MVNFKIKDGLFSDGELNAIAVLHSQSINLGFLSQLGSSFLFYLYKSLMECDDSILIVAKHEDDIVGFVSGSTCLGSFYKHMIRHHLVGVITALTPIVFSPSKLKRVTEALFYSKQGNGADGLPHGELLSLAVREDFRRASIAKELCQKLIEQFKKNELDEFKIIVGEELSGAQRFYEKIGAEKVGMTEVHKGSRSFIYRLEI